MANISTQINAIQDAQYGSQVRTAICTALTAMNVESDAAVTANTEAQTAKTAAQTAATTANSAKTAAQTSATNAATSATNADSSKTAAASSATSAASSATSASNSASTATTAKNDAVSAKNDAVSAKTAAESAKSAAQTAATNAATSETNAATSASTATTAKNDAVSAKTTAVSAKNDAVSAKTAAQTSATNAATSETNAAASASTATTAKNDAVSAKTAAQTAATSAASSATSASNSADTATAAKVDAIDAKTAAISAKNDAVSAKTSVEGVASMVSDIEDYIQALYFSSRNHRNILRGKNLGTSITAAQWAAIQSGDFTDMYIGDYWVLDDTKYYIADIDLMYNRTESRNGNELKLHHLFIIPNKRLSSNAAMYESSSSVSTGYRGSLVESAVRQYANNALTGLFGDHLLSVKHTYHMNYTDGIPQAGSMVTNTIKATIPTEKQLFGFPVNSIVNDGSNGYRCKVEPYGQLAIFALDRLFLSNLCSEIFPGTGYFWLQDTCSAMEFAAINENGIPDVRASNTTNSILPLFCIGVEEEESS